MDSTLTSIFHRFTTDNLAATSIAFGWRVASALLVFVIGLVVMRLLMSVSRTTLRRTVNETTVRSYAEHALRGFLWVFLLIVILGVFGVETTAVAALLGAAGLAIGLALQGTLSNFASGFMLLLFHPFRAGDIVEVAGVTGRVVEIGIFSTTIDTPENIRAFVPNSAIFTGVIKNRTSNGYLRLEIRLTVDLASDVSRVRQILRRVLEQNDMVLETPRAEIHVVEDPNPGITFALRPYALSENVDRVRSVLTAAVREEVRNAGVTITR